MGFSIIFPFLPLYVEDLGTRTTISIEFWAGMVFSSQAITMMIAAPIWGAVADRFGRKLMVERATFGGVIIIFLMAFARSAEELVLMRAVQGLITGTISAASALVAAQTPRSHTGYAMGILQVGFWAGIAVGPLIGGVLADAFGFRLPFLITAGMLLVSGVMVHWGVREIFTPEERSVNKRRGFVGEWRHVLSMNGVRETFTINFLGALSRSMITPVAPLYVTLLLTHGVSEAFLFPVPDLFQGFFEHAARVSTYTGLIVGVASATATASAVYLGRLGDRLGHRTVVIGSALAGMLFYLPQGLVTEPWQLLLLQGLTGLASGGLVASGSALLVQYTQPGEEGAVYGLDSSISSGARAIAPLVGASLAVWLGLRLTFSVTMVMFGIVALMAMLMLPHTRHESVQPPQRLEPQPQPAGAD